MAMVQDATKESFRIEMDSDEISIDKPEQVQPEISHSEESFSEKIVRMCTKSDFDWKSGSFPKNTTKGLFTLGIILGTVYYMWCSIALWVGLKYTVLAIANGSLGDMFLWLFFILMGHKVASIAMSIIGAQKGIPWMMFLGLGMGSICTVIEGLFLLGYFVFLVLFADSELEVLWFLALFEIKTIAASVFYFGKMIMPHKDLLKQLRCQIKFSFDEAAERNEHLQDIQPLLEEV